MNLTELYNQLCVDKISEEEFSQACNLTHNQYKLRVAKWGPRFPLMLSVLDKIAADEITRDEAAKSLGIGTRAINSLSERWRVARPIKDYRFKDAASQVKWELRKKAAIDYIGGADLIDCAVRAQCSDRQLRRWISDLLDKHFQIVWRDLSTLSPEQRRCLAEDIEKAEKFEYEKISTLNAIARGEKTIEGAALERVVKTTKYR